MRITIIYNQSSVESYFRILQGIVTDATESDARAGQLCTIAVGY